MDNFNSLIVKRDELFKQIRELNKHIGISNHNDVNTLSELILKQAKLTAKISKCNVESNKVFKEANSLLSTSTKIEKLLAAIKRQRWFFFENKVDLMFDGLTGILWPNLNSFNTRKGENSFYTLEEAKDIVKELNLDDFVYWTIPSEGHIMDILNDSKFPFLNIINKATYPPTYFYCTDQFSQIKFFTQNDNDSSDINKLLGTYTSKISKVELLPCNICFSYSNHRNSYNKHELSRLALNFFLNNKMEPQFNDLEAKETYRNISIMHNLLHKLNGLEIDILMGQEKLLLSNIDYEVLLLNYELDSIDKSIIRYYKSITSIVDELMDKVNYYEMVKKEIIQEFNIIELKLAGEYSVNPNFDNDENNIFRERKTFLEKNFKLNMNDVKKQLVSYKNQATNIGQRIDEINGRDDSIKELAVLEKEDRASFELIVENISEIIKEALLKIEFFESNKNLAIDIINLWDEWNENYKIFKTTGKIKFEKICENGRIEEEIYKQWFEQWKKQRLVIEELFIPLVEYSLKGRLNYYTNEETTIFRKVFNLLGGYKVNIDNFYIEKRKNLHNKFAFETGGNLQEKIETESQLYKIALNFQEDLQEVIFSLDNVEDRLFLLKWMAILSELQIDEILEFLKTKELITISMDILKEFADLKCKNYEAFILDSIAYKEEAQRREDEFNDLLFRMRKDLI